eukprot:7158221-Prymnesium_polylepis.1
MCAAGSGGCSTSSWLPPPARRKELARQAGQPRRRSRPKCRSRSRVRPTRAQRRRAQRKWCAQRMRSGCGFDSGRSGGTG